MSDRELINVPDSVRIVSAEAPLGSYYWRLIKLECWDNKRSKGSHYIYAYNESVDEESAEMVISDGAGSQRLSLGGSSYYAPLSSGNTYSAEIDGALSDRVEGMEVSSHGISSYSLWWEFVLSIEDYDTFEDPGLAEQLIKSGEEYRLLELNPQAPLLKAILQDGFIPTSEEILIEYKGDYYTAQSAQRVSDSTMRVYYVASGNLSEVKWVEK